ncbi:hypothetical protein [Coleofasciculus sp. FACHB-1120]|uniref:hypothetical protein n=1 Tax=Coleofasciculus sp. FACHB-1120 TaxID=2692783 RepID=UPI0018F0252B|nr:hypothetical protein [Coleofasciculus sp. FACHB-1120]
MSWQKPIALSVFLALALVCLGYFVEFSGAWFAQLALFVVFHTSVEMKAGFFGSLSWLFVVFHCFLID